MVYSYISIDISQLFLIFHHAFISFRVNVID